MIKIDISLKLPTVKLNVQTNIKNRSFIALSGESGSGKTTLLRVIAGLQRSEGVIEVDGEIWQDKDRFLMPQKRGIGFVFQDYALFSNMSVLENLLYIKKDKKLALELLELVELADLKDRSSNALSGGQKQRVALIRALMNRPKLLLMDEPLSALDTTLRLKLQKELSLIHKEFELTTIFVSHDPSEIYRLADRVMLLKDGKIANDAKPKEVLLKSQGSQKFSFEAELLEIKRVDVVYIAVVSIGQQIAEVVLSKDEVKDIKVGDKIRLSTKAFAPTIKKVS